MPPGDVVAVGVEAGGVGVGHVGDAEPVVGFYGVGEVGGVVGEGVGLGFGVGVGISLRGSVGAVAAARLVVGGCGSGGEEWRVVVVAGEVEIHAYTRGDEEFVRDGILVRAQMSVPDHAAVAEGGVPAVGGEVVEEAGTVGGCGFQLSAVPGLMEEVASRCLVRRAHRRVEIHELDVFEPAKDDPEHVVVGLLAEAERVFAKVEDRGLAEVAVDEIVPGEGVGAGGVVD